MLINFLTRAKKFLNFVIWREEGEEHEYALLTIPPQGKARAAGTDIIVTKYFWYFIVNKNMMVNFSVDYLYLSTNTFGKCLSASLQIFTNNTKWLYCGIHSYILFYLPYNSGGRYTHGGGSFHTDKLCQI